MAGKHEYHHARRPLDRMSIEETKQFSIGVGCVDWNELVADGRYFARRQDYQRTSTQRSRRMRIGS